MKKYQIGNDMSPFLWGKSQVNPEWANFIIEIDRRLHAVDPKSHVGHDGGPDLPSGCTWLLWVDAKGKSTESPGWALGVERWKVALSYRGPLITALSWIREGEPPSDVTNSLLVALCRSLSADLGLTYLDAHELMQCEIPWDELTEEAGGRLDWSEANAFNLLFYEY